MKRSTVENIIKKNFGENAINDMEIKINPCSFYGYVNIEEYMDINSNQLLENDIDIRYIYMISEKIDGCVYINKQRVALIEDMSKIKDLEDYKLIEKNLYKFLNFISNHVNSTIQAINNCIF